MNSIYSVERLDDVRGVALTNVWTQQAGEGLATGYTNFATVPHESGTVLFAYNKHADTTDVFTLFDGAPWVQPQAKDISLAGGPWDDMAAFVFGDVCHLMTYRRDTGAFAFFRVGHDLSVSRPYDFMLARNTPTRGFTTIAPFTALGQQYVLGYDFDTGVVASFSLLMTATSGGGVPPLIARTVWYHQWAKGWTRFAFFQLGGGSYFFKINKAKLNVNIDHIQDDPAVGTVEVGSNLQAQLPDALSIDQAMCLPWPHGEPLLLTYISSTGVTAVYRIHSDCLGWTPIHVSITAPQASLSVSYRVRDKTYAMFYGG